MDLRHLRHFLALSETRSFRRAAEHLGLTQPALSKSIRSLEDDLGVRLFDRHKDGVVLTAVGTVMLTHAKLITAEVRHAVDAIGSARTGMQGEVVIGAAFSMVETLVPLATAKLMEQRPGVRVQLYSGLNDSLFAALHRGDMDLVLAAIPEATQSDDLIHEQLFVDQVHVVVRVGHPLAEHRPTIGKLLAYPWVLFGPRVLSKQRLDAAFLTAGYPPPMPTVESNSSTYNKALVRSSDFISYMPYQLFRAEHSVGQLVPLSVAGLDWSRPVGIAHRRRGSLSPSAKALIAEIRVAVRDVEQAGSGLSVVR